MCQPDICWLPPRVDRCLKDHPNRLELGSQTDGSGLVVRDWAPPILVATVAALSTIARDVECIGPPGWSWLVMASSRSLADQQDWLELSLL